MYAELSCGRRVQKSCQKYQDASTNSTTDTGPKAFYDERAIAGAVKVLGISE
jgi:hypothetical protein